MISKETKVLIAEHAIENNIPAKDLQDIINFYFREIVWSCSNLMHPRVGIEGLGHMEFEEWKVPPLRKGKPPYELIYKQLEADKKKREETKLRKATRTFTKQTMRDKKSKAKKFNQ